MTNKDKLRERFLRDPLLAVLGDSLPHWDVFHLPLENPPTQT